MTPVTKLGKRNKTTSKKMCDGVLSENRDVIAILAMRKPIPDA